MKLLYLSIITLLSTLALAPKSEKDVEIERLRNIVIEQKKQITTVERDRDYFAEQLEIKSRENNVLPMGKPLDNLIINSSYKSLRKHPIKKAYLPHRAIDYHAREGQVVYATGDGVVSLRYDRNGYGNYIIVSHEVGSYDSGFDTKYAHLKQFLVKDGEQVRKGQIIGLVGSTGMATGPHLHYELIKDNQNLNPSLFEI